MNITYGDGRESGPDAHPDNLDQQVANTVEHIIITARMRDAYRNHRATEGNLPS